MKRLLLSLLAAIALPTFAGDLGSADFLKIDDESLSKQKDRSQDFGQLRCGWKGENKCEGKFIDGRLIIDGSKGITPDQIIHFEWLTPFQRNEDRYAIQIIYKDSQGIINVARIVRFIHTSMGYESWQRFQNEFLYFVNQKI